MRVLYAREKHGDRILAAGDEWELAQASVKLLLERYDEGWYYDPNDIEEYRAEPPYSAAQVEALPEGSGARREAEREMERWEKAAKERENAHKFWDCVKAVAEARDANVLDEIYAQTTGIFTGRIGVKDPAKPFGQGNMLSPIEQFPTAWALLHFRRDHEYEYVELRDVEEA